VVKSAVINIQSLCQLLKNSGENKMQRNTNTFGLDDEHAITLNCARRAEDLFDIPASILPSSLFNNKNARSISATCSWHQNGNKMYAGTISINNRITLEGVVTELVDGSLLIHNPDNSIISANIDGIEYKARKIQVKGLSITVDDHVLNEERNGVFTDRSNP
jgi:hypothetical protein